MIIAEIEARRHNHQKILFQYQRIHKQTPMFMRWLWKLWISSLVIFTDLCENEVTIPIPPGSNFENTVVMALKDDSPVDPDPVIIGYNLFSVPILDK